MHYDLVIIGNGIFGKLFLYEINRQLKNKSVESFRIAHIFNEELAPACSLRTTSTVSFNGISEGVSNLGDELLEGVKSFKEFAENHKDHGIYPSKQFVLAFQDKKKDALKMRFKEKVQLIHSPFLKHELEGVELDSYIVIPEIFFNQISLGKNQSASLKVDTFVALANNVQEVEGAIEVEIAGKTERIKASKVVLATGAYSKLFAPLFVHTDFSEKIHQTKIVAGSYLIKKVNPTGVFENDLYLTIDGHNLVYRRATKELIIGSTTVEGAITAPDLVSLRKIFDEVVVQLTFDVGPFETFEVVTGLRHKGQKRMPFFGPIDQSKRIWFFNGAYKNGWSLPFYYIKRDMHQFI